MHFTTTPAALQLARKWTRTEKELESFPDHLSHATIRIPKGRVFLHQMFLPLSCGQAHHHYIRLNLGTWADLMWWRAFLQGWSGKSFIPVMSTSSEIFSDAVGTFDCGALTSTHHWIQISWPDNWHSVHITAKELLPAVVAPAGQGPLWSHQWICFRCDHMAVVKLLKSQTSQDQLLMHLLSLLAAYFRFQLGNPRARRSECRTTPQHVTQLLLPHAIHFLIIAEIIYCRKLFTF